MTHDHHLWLPYTQMKLAPEPLEVVGAQGCRIRLKDGRELIDGIASWWTAAHGYNHPHIRAMAQKQLEALPHVMFGGLVHEPALTLATRLSTMTGMEHVFFADSGSVAVEVALKMALQYWRNLGKPGKERFLCFTHGYHGDTFGAMSVSDPEHALHKAFRHSVIKQYVVDIPTDEYGFGEFASLLDGTHGQVAGVIIEPLVQGAGGMKFHSADVLAEIHRMTKQHELLFIADEIATGFYRTGARFACDEAGITPDILCVGKALTGGTITLAGTLARDEIFQAFYSDDREAALMHGPTYMANPLACAAANASLDIFEKENYAEKTSRIETQLATELAMCEKLPGVIDVRAKGAVGVVQIDPKVHDVYRLRQEFVKHGVWIRPFGDVVYLMPPLVIGEEELSLLCTAIVNVLRSR